MRAISVFVYADDVVSQAGVEHLLRSRPGIGLATTSIDEVDVAVVVTDRVDARTATTVRAVQRDGCPRVLVLASELDADDVLAAGEAGAAGVLRRLDCTPEALAQAVHDVAAGDGSVPADLLAGVLRQVGRLRREAAEGPGRGGSGLSTREAQVLRLVAEGHGTAEIADQLCYSERTVKGVIHDVTTRLQLRNRSHAVAFALRNGLI